ncbi:MAG: hypothetical protein MUC31_06320, partial [Bacteroidales bacterium]|nr:hypothetical protein [Bacteroidales bacterium]
MAITSERLDQLFKVPGACIPASWGSLQRQRRYPISITEELVAGFIMGNKNQPDSYKKAHAVPVFGYLRNCNYLLFYDTNGLYDNDPLMTIHPGNFNRFFQ